MKKKNHTTFWLSTITGLEYSRLDWWTVTKSVPLIIQAEIWEVVFAHISVLVNKMNNNQ